jgi:hypothetical protein
MSTLISQKASPRVLASALRVAVAGLVVLGAVAHVEPAEAKKRSKESVVIPLPPSGSPQTGPLQTPAQNARVRFSPGTIPTQRGIIVLPLKTGPNWKANPIFTRALVARAEGTLRRALGETSRYAVFETGRFDPVLQRGVADESYTQEDFEAFIAEPTLERARPIAAKVGFGRQPKLAFSEGTLIADFTLDEIQVANGDIRIGVIGRFYDPQYVEPVLTYNVLGAAQPKTLRSGVVPTPLIGSLRTGTAVDNALASATTAFVRIAQESIKTPVALTNPLAEAPKFTSIDGATTEETAAETTEETPAE